MAAFLAATVARPPAVVWPSPGVPQASTGLAASSAPAPRGLPGPAAGSGAWVSAALAAFAALGGVQRQRTRRRVGRGQEPRTNFRGNRGGGARIVAPQAFSGLNQDLSTISEGLVQQRTPGKKTGVLLLNIGTPASTQVEDVRTYLGKFLDDDRVIDITPKLLKNVLLQVLLAIRPASSAENYKKIWDPVRGSPLLFHTQDLAEALQAELGDDFIVRIGFSYSEPFVQDALQGMAKVGVDDVLLVPMFPHYASSTTGSILANAYRTASEVFCTPYLRVVPPFFNNPLYLQAMAESIEPSIGPRGSGVDHVLFSFHGLPERQCSQTDDTKQVCLQQPNCCAGINTANRNCYRAQCFETARLLARRLDLPEDSWSIGFQSRLTLRGSIQWVRPYTDEAIDDLARAGKTRLAVIAPSFTADCVETLEELGITGREDFYEAGGKELIVVPCLNCDPSWVKALSQILLDQISGSVASAKEAESSFDVTSSLEDEVVMLRKNNISALA